MDTEKKGQYLPKEMKKHLGYDIRPGHKGKTMAGKILSVRGLYDKAVEVLEGNLSQGDLKAAIFAIEQVDGKAKQKIDVTSKNKQLNTAPIFLTTDPELKSIVEKLSSGE